MYPWKEAFASFKCHWSTKPSLHSISLSKTFSSICHEVLFMWKRLQGKYDYSKFWNAETVTSIITSSVFMLRQQIMYSWKEAFLLLCD